jgi:hypothetical protein
MNPFHSLAEYERFVYTLKANFPFVLRSTLVLVRRGRRVAILQGDLYFADGLRLSVKERLSADIGVVQIESYGYELWRHAEKFAWYDSQPHPNNPALASTHPHHKHVPPNIKKNRIPAPGISFMKPNLPYLLSEMESILSDKNE